MSLLDQVRDLIRKKPYSIRTEQAYVEWIKRFVSFHKRCPKYLTEKEIKGKNVFKFIKYCLRKKIISIPGGSDAAKDQDCQR